MTHFEHGHSLISDPTAVRTGDQAGGNEGGFYTLATAFPDLFPSEYYVKRAQSSEHGNNEALAAYLYRAMGVAAPVVSYCSDGWLYSPIVSGEQDMHERIHEPEWVARLQYGFIADAWLANWDVFGLAYDNIITTPDGHPVRIDMGGALKFRAMGEPKGADFGPEVGELDTYKTGKKALVFGDMPLDALRAGLDGLRLMTPSVINWAVASFGGDSNLASLLVKRRQYILDYYEL